MLIKTFDQQTLSLENFEGPLDFLLHLIQKSEIDLYDVSIQSIMQQYRHSLEEVLSPCVNGGAEFVSKTAWLVWLKSKLLLPKQEETSNSEEDSTSLEMLHHLIDYCRFKEAAQELTRREDTQRFFYEKGGISFAAQPQKKLGIEHLSLEELAGIFRTILEKASTKREYLVEETWTVAEKIAWLQKLVHQQQKVNFSEVFSEKSSREELIVTFLALLELMKMGEVVVARETSQEELYLIKAP